MQIAALLINGYFDGVGHISELFAINKSSHLMFSRATSQQAIYVLSFIKCGFPVVGTNSNIIIKMEIMGKYQRP